MSIRKGLRFGDDGDEPPINPQEYGATGFNADRGRTNFEKDVDSLLFGDNKPVVRRGARPQPAPAQPSKPAQKPAQKSKAPVVTQPPKPQPPKQKPAPPPPAVKPKPKQQPTTKPQPKIIQPPTPPTPAVQQKIKQVIEQQPKNIKQVDSNDVVATIDNNTQFNRPGYIRKLKKVAEDFNFVSQNSDHHRFIQVLRPSQCLRNIVKKQNCPNYHDHEFPANWTSISNSAPADSSITWKSPEQIFKSPVFGKYVDPNDIQLGLMSSPQFLSTLSCLAERQQNIKRLIENQKNNSNGFYYVRINVNGVWRYVAVDHLLPESNGRGIGARSFNDSESELWVSLIEKAYAKVYHGYDCFKTTVPREHYLRDLTGAPVRKVQPSDPDFSAIINEAIGFGWPVLAVPSQKIIDLGFNPNFSLSIVKQSSKGFQFRSSWGTIVQRPKVNISKQGVFEIASSQIKDYISYVCYAETDSSLYSTTIQSKHCPDFYSCYNFKISKPNPNATITISQFDRRLLPHNFDYEYVPFRVVLQKRDIDDGQNHSLYVTSGFSYKARNLELAVNLNPGTYYLYCVGSWKTNVHYDYNVTAYANEFVTFSKINHTNFPNLIAEALTQQCLGSGKRSAKGNVDEYILYHEPSNLVLITALSLVDRAFNHTLNLQQVKPDNLSLVNVVKPEDNFTKKSRQENGDYKSSVFNQKTWDVSLLPHEKYTWVISSNQDYDPNNFKNWGFK